MNEIGQQLAIVTGSNRGLGLETCRHLAQHGIGVVLTSRDAAKGQTETDHLRAQGLVVPSAGRNQSRQRGRVSHNVAARGGPGRCTHQ